MALVKPLKISNGIISQFTSADTLDAAIVEKDVVNLTNSNASAITIGQPVYAKTTASAVDLAQANALSTAYVIGLVAATSIAAAGSGTIQTDGVITSSDWTSVIGSTTLTAGAKYYLDPAAAGQLTATAPTTAGQFVVFVGTALSTTEFEISIYAPIGL